MTPVLVADRLTEDMRRSLAPLLLVGSCLPSAQCFTGLTTTAVRRAGVPVVGTSSNAPVALISRARSARCRKDGRCGTAAAAMMVSKSAALAEEARVDPYEIEAELVEEDKAV